MLKNNFSPFKINIGWVIGKCDYYLLAIVSESLDLCYPGVGWLYLIILCVVMSDALVNMRKKSYGSKKGASF